MRMPWSRVQEAGAIALLLVPALLLWLRCETSPRAIWIAHDPRGAWIAAQSPVTVQAQEVHEKEPLTTFVRSFEATSPAGPVTLHVRALRDLELSINGRTLTDLDRSPEDWKREATADVSALLVPGTNEIRATVRNARGPALLALHLEGLAAPLGTDASWTAQQEGALPFPAVIANDTRPHPSVGAGPQAWASLVERAPLLLGLFAISAVGCLAWQRLAGARLRAALPQLALGAGLALFSAAVIGTYMRIPVRAGFGFDLGNHLAYVDFIRNQHALPLATDGWSMYHPPLFYVVSALLVDAFTALVPQVDPWSALRVLPFAAGLVNVVVSWELVRSLFPGDVRASTLAALFAAALPLNLVMSAYPSNEAPHAALVSLALLVVVRALCAERTGTGAPLAAGALFGLALLTKFTALVVVPVAAFFLAAKLVILERLSPARVAGRISLFALALVGVCGWWYARNVIHFGHAIVGNWDLPNDALAWWQQPGFHTAAYYTHFGAALDRPFFSGFRSFWDAIYASFWADGWLGGRAAVSPRRPAFDYRLMAAVVLLALPATLALIVGALRAVGLALRGQDAHRRAALSFLLTSSWAIFLAMLYVTVELPYFGQARAPYGLALVSPLAMFFALGLAPPRGRLVPGGHVTECLLAGWLGALFGASWLALWA